MKIMKLFVSDIDGTLVWYNGKNNQEASDLCKDAIRKWMDAGNIFAVATARSHVRRDIIYDFLGFKIDYLGGNGSEIVYLNQEIELHTLPYSYFLELCDWIREKEYNATLKICVDNKFYIYKRNNYPYGCLDRVRSYLFNIEDYTLIRHDSNTVGFNMGIICYPSLTKIMEKELQELFKNRCTVSAIDFDYIAIVPIGVSKGQAVLELAERYNVKRKNIIVAGDEVNDVCMFKVAGKSYCMSHASIEIQKEADGCIDVLEEALHKEMNE